MTETSRVAIVVLLGLVTLAAAGEAATTVRSEVVRVTTATAEPVNINTAGVKELMTLEGIGRKVAEKIIEYRAANGPFKKPEEIRRVQGVGAGLWEKNRDRVVVK